MTIIRSIRSLSGMGKRLLFGSLLIALLVGMVLGDRAIGFPLCGLAIALLLTLVAQSELVSMFRGQRRPVVPVVLLVTAGLFVAKAVFGPLGWGVTSAEVTLWALCFGVLAILTQATLRLQFAVDDESRAHVEDVAAGIFALGYLALPLSFLADLALQQPGGEGTLFAAIIVFISKCGDIGGYLGGSTLGKHRVMPRVSPKKSWEGSSAGLLLTVGAALGLGKLFPELFEGFSTVELVILGIVMNVATQLGDFSESMIKRSCSVKDSGNIVPTFGGAMDIIDSLVFSIPAAALVIAWAA